MRRTRLNGLTGLTALVAAATLGLAACGAGSPTSAAPPQNAPAASSTSSDMGSMPGMTTTGSGAAAASGASGSAAPAAGTQVVIQGFAYQVAGPVPAGSTVTVRNEDNVAHTVTSDTAGQFDVTVAAHATATFTAPRTAGSYAIHCTFHPNMHGELVVR